MNLEPVDLPDLRLRIRAFFEWLRSPFPEAATVNGQPVDHDGLHLESYQGILADLRAMKGPWNTEVPAAVRARWQGLGLRETPVIVLSGQAPGGDQLVAEVADQLGHRVEVPLPFPPEVMKFATTYTQPLPEGAVGGGEPWKGAEASTEHPHYQVMLQEDLARGIPDLGTFRTLASSSEPQHQASRRTRYRAVGEFIATHSHLLLVLDDALADRATPGPGLARDFTVAGTATALEARRAGPSPGLLPDSGALDPSRNGPTLFLRVRRRKNGAPAPATPAPGECCWIHPDEGLPPGPSGPADGARDEAAAGRAASWLRLHDLVAGLERLAVELPAPTPGPGNGGASPGAASPQGRGPLPGQPWLAEVYEVRERVAAASRAVDREVKAIRRNLLYLGVAVLVLIPFAEFWIPDQAAVARPALHHALRCVAAVLALGCFLQALYRLRRAQGRLWPWLARLARPRDPEIQRGSLFAREEEFRVLAEAMRVQSHWLAAGVGRSAAAAYLRRDRSGLHWIRSALWAHGFPHEHARFRFHDLPPGEQWRVLEWVRENWVRGQVRYFITKAAKLDHAHRLAEFQAGFFASAGFTSFLLTLAYHLTHASFLVHGLSVAAGLFVASLAVLGARVFYLVVSEGPTWFATRAEKPASLPGAPPAHHPHAFPGEWFLGMALAVGLIAVIHGLPVNGWLPSPERFPYLLVGLFFGLAAYGHRDSDWRFLADNIRRYRAMQSLFAEADRRLGVLLEGLRPDPPASPSLTPDPRVREVQDLLEELGREAVIENAEWYVLHRTHPLQPIQPH